MLNIEGIESVLHRGSVRCQGKICVPLSLMAKVSKATDAFAHPGVDKTVEMLDRRYKFTVLKRQWSDLVSAVVEGCAVCQATKHSRGTQPELNQSYPIQEYPFSSVCMDFCDITSDPCTHRNTEYDYVLIFCLQVNGVCPCSSMPKNSDLRRIG